MDFSADPEGRPPVGPPRGAGLARWPAGSARGVWWSSAGGGSGAGPGPAVLTAWAARSSASRMYIPRSWPWAQARASRWSYSASGTLASRKFSRMVFCFQING